MTRDRSSSHALTVRLTHWVNAFAIFCMVRSGWAIYNASPLFNFAFPSSLTMGGWLGGALAIHFAAMWLLTINYTIYVSYSVLSGHLRRRMLPIRPADVWREILLALRFRLPHESGVYNAVQRLLYLGVAAAIGLEILSGLALWKPVQLQSLSWIMGGYEGTRVVHFLMMAAITGFVIVHVALVAIVPRTLPPMIFSASPKGSR